MRLMQGIEAVMGGQSIRGECKGSFYTLLGVTAPWHQKHQRFTQLPTPVSAHCFTPACL